MKKTRASNDKGFLTSGENISYWIDSAKPMEFETLDKPVETDVLIIGGGIAGLTTACPCHGSRFTKKGIVVNGPATTGLEKIVIKE